MIRYFNLSLEDCVGEDFRYVCNESCHAVSLRVGSMLDAFEHDDRAAWNPHGLQQIGVVQDFVSSVLLGSNSLYFDERTLQDFSWIPVADA
jgi:hypothetical protein